MIKWQPEWTALLGTLPDAALGKRLGVTTETTRNRRRRRGIPAFTGKYLVQCSWCGKDIMRGKNTEDVACDDCKRAYQVDWHNRDRRQHPEEHRAYMRARYAKNREHERATRRAWEKRNRKRMAEYKERSNEKERVKRLAAKDKAIDLRVAAELREERARLGMEHYGWARNVE